MLQIYDLLLLTPVPLMHFYVAGNPINCTCTNYTWRRDNQAILVVGKKCELFNLANNAAVFMAEQHLKRYSRNYV